MELSNKYEYLQKCMIFMYDWLKLSKFCILYKFKLQLLKNLFKKYGFTTAFK